MSSVSHRTARRKSPHLKTPSSRTSDVVARPPTDESPSCAQKRRYGKQTKAHVAIPLTERLKRGNLCGKPEDTMKYPNEKFQVADPGARGTGPASKDALGCFWAWPLSRPQI